LLSKVEEHKYQSFHDLLSTWSNKRIISLKIDAATWSSAMEQESHSDFTRGPEQKRARIEYFNS
jgi:hypothetical protein